MNPIELPDASEAPARRGLKLWLSRLEGPQTMGRGPAFWAVVVLAVLAALSYPAFANDYVVGNAAYFFVWTFMAMGLGVVWGYCGALSFGQTAFFGLAGYAYGVITINIGSAFGATWLALLLAVALGGVFALLIGISCSTGGSRAYSSASSRCRSPWCSRHSWRRPPGHNGASGTRG